MAELHGIENDDGLIQTVKYFAVHGSVRDSLKLELNRQLKEPEKDVLHFWYHYQEPR